VEIARYPPVAPSGDHLDTEMEGPVALQIWTIQPLKSCVDRRLNRHPPELHAWLVGSAATFAVVARATSGGEVIPRVATAAVSRHHVIESELACASATVEALVSIACEDRSSRQPSGEALAAYVRHEPDDGRPRVFRHRRTYRYISQVEDFSLAADDQDEARRTVAIWSGA
jgi:hypothetical protein